MSISVLILLFVVLAAVAFAVIWRNVSQQKQPRKRFRVGGSSRDRLHPVRGRRMSYTQIARARRDSSAQGKPSTKRSPRQTKRGSP